MGRVQVVMGSEVLGEHGSKEIAERAIARVYAVRHEGPFEIREQGYVTRGSVRGGCGHIHRSLATAIACVERDHRGCVSQGGYSDRMVYRRDGASFSEAERDEYTAVYEARR